MVYIPGQKLKGWEKGYLTPFLTLLIINASLSSVRLAEGPLWGRGTKGDGNRVVSVVFNLSRLGAHFGECMGTSLTPTYQWSRKPYTQGWIMTRLGGGAGLGGANLRVWVLNIP